MITLHLHFEFTIFTNNTCKTQPFHLATVKERGRDEGLAPSLYSAAGGLARGPRGGGRGPRGGARAEGGGRPTGGPRGPPRGGGGCTPLGGGPSCPGRPLVGPPRGGPGILIPPTRGLPLATPTPAW